ncbi:YbaB/EbfC family nucleoid-associated protein [Amycolatopsis taiwanensis]|uniref:YbaB/EbfC DNA-binding family protein n=1 Tax=Amycolatopsis taiwanensis TaxID=342230 RepID=A0A9W6VFM0_9PSEU|nr:YbaB/EbfC family nucleoid-associated protein [Amycolatopsis taiwanensis]GLY65632.1 hypothetical protein Atai01_22510 [Amycolatopsis taiwanensis]
MTDPFAEKNAELLRHADDVAEKARRYQEMRAGLATVAVTESSPDGAVTVTVDASGLLTGLRIEDRGAPQPGRQVAATVLATLRRAQSRLPQLAAEVMRSIEDDPAAVDEALAGYRDRFPEPPPADVVTSPAPSPAMNARADNGAWGTRR